MDLFEYASYKNTNEESGDTLRKSESKARKQERKVLDCFVAGQYMSQPSIRREYFRRYGVELQIASCSRAVSNLTDNGKIEKTDVKVPGDYGKDVLTWILK